MGDGLVSWEYILGSIISGGLLTGLIEIIREMTGSKGRVSEKRTADETDLSRILLEQNHEGDMMVRNSLIQQVQECRVEIKTLQTRIETMFEEAINQEKLIARQEVSISAQMSKIEAKDLEVEKLRTELSKFYPNDQ